MRSRLERWTLHRVLSLPRTAQRILAGRARVVEGQTLDPALQLGLKLHRRAHPKPMESLSVEQARKVAARTLAAFDGAAVAMATVTDFSIPGGDDQPLPVRWYHPTAVVGSRPMLLYFHGGGHVVCDLDTHDSACRFIAGCADIPVLSVDYRRAPEAPFPLPFEDALAAYRWARDHGPSRGIDPQRIAIGGDSAGANLSAAVCAWLAQRLEPGPAFQLLLYPMLDARLRGESYRLFGQGYGLDTSLIRWFRALHLGADGDPADVRVSPLLHESLAGLPPCYIAAAGFDPLRDDAAAWARRLRRAGVQVQHVCHTDLIHGFVSFTSVHAGARSAVERAAAAMRVALSG